MKQSSETGKEKVMSLSKRFTPLQYHEQQRAFWISDKRFEIVVAGRRAGKTEIAMRKLVQSAVPFSAFDNGLFIAGAPTRQQAKHIFWDDLQSMIPAWSTLRINETELAIELITGTKIWITGLDKPQRIEGAAIDGAIIDEYDECKSDTWDKHLRPAISTMNRLGWAILMGVSRGKGNLKRRMKEAKENPDDYAAFTWSSKGIIDDKELQLAADTLDDHTFREEYGGEIVEVGGYVYYSYSDANHAAVAYDKTLPLIFCFDFNVAPGTALICQDHIFIEKQRYSDGFEEITKSENYTHIFDEVYIPNNSNTPIVCDVLHTRYSGHNGRIYCYGDATGGARGTANVAGSDWDIIKSMFNRMFPGQVSYLYRDANPTERARINAVNSRLRSASGKVKLFLDPKKVPHLVNDFESVSYLEGASEIKVDKDSDPMLTHLSEALGYFIERKYGVDESRTPAEHKVLS